MAFNKRPILYVEDDPHWQETVMRVLAHSYDVSIYKTLEGAKETQSMYEFDCFICGGIVAGVDTSIWAKELKQKGENVVILSDIDRPEGENIPFADKRQFGIGTTLMLAIEAAYGR